MKEDTPDYGPEPAQLKFLRRLVTVLTAVMILGVLTIVALLVIRLMEPPAIGLPDQITLPSGVNPIAITRSDNWFAVVTDDNRILIFDAESGEIRQEVAVVNE
jgi:hypothetical protein